VLATLEGIARHQPIGVSALARLLEDDKSAIQRAIMSLAHDGWVRPSGNPTRWVLTSKVYSLANTGRGRIDLRRRAHGLLDELRNESGESVALMVADLSGCVVIDVLESRQSVRTVTNVGRILPPRETASGRAVLAAMSDEQLLQFLGAEPEPELAAQIELTRTRGYSISDGEAAAGSTNLGAAVVDPADGTIAAVTILAPSDRMPAERQEALGAMVAGVAHRLSRELAAEHRRQ
jgi:IclR family acetate operon transcriptional repressor